MARNVLDFFPGIEDSGLSLSTKTMGGMFANGRCRWKWFGVRGSSFSGWSLTWVSGRKINIGSVSAEIVVITLSVSFSDPKIIRSSFPGDHQSEVQKEDYIHNRFLRREEFSSEQLRSHRQTGLQFTSRCDKVLTVIGTQQTRVSSSGSEAA